MHATANAEVRHREGLPIAAFESDVAAVHRQKSGVQSRGRGSCERNVGATSCGNCESVGGELDVGPCVDCRRRGSGNDQLSLTGGESIDSRRLCMTKLVSNCLRSSVLDAESVLSNEVIGVVEGDAC